MTFEIEQIPVLEDNYAWLLTDKHSGFRAVVDPGEASPVLRVLGEGRLDLILLTHHHADHVDGVEALRRKYKANVGGAASERRRLPQLDLVFADGDAVVIGNTQGEVIATPGHADGHLSFYFPSGPALFCGDALFSLGCGKLIEGTASELYQSLQRFAPLPDETLVCCGHEYTAANGRFALSVDPQNKALQQRFTDVQRLRASALPTVPIALGIERETNPFLRAPDLARFVHLRAAKDHF